MHQSVELANQLISNFSNQDVKINEIVDCIETQLSVINTAGFNVKSATQTVLSCEFLFVKVRSLVEFEQIKIKQILQQSEIDVIKPLVKKRELYLSQVSMSLDKIQSDISNLQRLVYYNSYK